MNRFKQGAALALAMTMALAGCSGKDGSNGANGQPGPSTGTLAGTVTIAGTAQLPVVGATIALSPAVAGVTITTNATGNYSAVVPVGVYTLTITASNLVTQTKTVSVIAATTATQNVALVATSPVVVGLTIAGLDPVTGTATPGQVLNVSAVATPLDGSTVTSVAWTTGVNAPVTFGDPTVTTTTATLPAVSGPLGFKANLFTSLNVSPLGDPDIAIQPPEIPPLFASSDNRLKVQAINNFDLGRAGEVTLTVTVKTSTNPDPGYQVTKVVSAALPFALSTGVASVPLNQPVVVHGFMAVPPATPQASYSYTLAGPSGDATSLLDSTTDRHPVFTPTISGKYTLTESVAGKTLDIYAGSWVGVIDTVATSAALVGGVGNPVGDANCLGCHDGFTAPDKFTPWSKSGHASIFTQNVNAGGHYTKACFDCHTVGNLTNANGIDQQSDFNAMLTAVFPPPGGSPVANPFNWKTILDTYPNTARMANIQCENCHGPQAVTGQSHSGANEAAIFATRVSLDAGVCGRCHGEPARHGRYQEWSISRHGNFQVAGAEGLNGSCSGCHSAQGAMVFFAQLATTPNRTITLPAGLTIENVLPQTCAVCHDPHDPGSTSSLGTDAKPRIMDNTSLLPSGFKAVGVGKGAICITCHNSRNGGWNDTSVVPNVFRANLHEDGDSHFGTLAAFAAPHEAAQGDVLMGRNAYFVNGVRGPHSLISNACVNCHMDSVAAPSEIGYSTQSNHTFEANLTICARCHGAFDGAGLQAATAAGLADLLATIDAKIVSLYETVGTTVVVTPGRTPTISVNGATAVNLITYLTGKVASAGTIDTFAKANWNYELIAVDNSGGVHNPSFAQDVLFQTSEKVNNLTTP